MLINYLKGRP